MNEFPKEREGLVDTGARRYPRYGERYYWMDANSIYGEGVHGPFTCANSEGVVKPFGAENAEGESQWSYPPESYAIYVEDDPLRQMARRLRKHEADIQQAILYNDGTVSWESAGHLRNRIKGRMERWAVRIAAEATLLDEMAAKGATA